MYRQNRLRLFAYGLFVVGLAITPVLLADDDDDDDGRSAVTVWWVVFNDPSACKAQDGENPDLGTVCNGPDLGPANGGVFHASGNVGDEDGNVIFVTSLYESPTTLNLGGPPPPFGNALHDAQGAEFHVVVRNHGPVIEEFADEQISTLVDPGCGNPNTCEDIQVAIFLPGAGEAEPFWISDGATVGGASAKLARHDDFVTLVLRTNVDRDDDGDSDDDSSRDDDSEDDSDSNGE